MKRNALFKPLTIGVTLCFLSLLGCGGGEQRQQKYLERAQSYYESESYDKAKIEVKNVLQINPNHAQARYLLGMIAEFNKEYRSAFSNFNAAVEIDPKHIKSLNKLANYYLLSKDSDSAMDKINSALKLDPNNADTLAALAMVHFDKKNHNKAIDAAQKSLSVDPGNIQATTVLTASYVKDDPDLALKTISDSIASQTKNESLKMLKIRLLTDQGKFEDVVTEYQSLISSYPENLFYPYQLVKFYLGNQQVDEEDRQEKAELILRSLVKDKPDEEQVKLWLVDFLVRYHSPIAGQKVLEQYVKDNPESFTLRDSLAKVYISLQHITKAKALYNYVIDNDPKSAISIDARNRLISLALVEKRKKEAEKLLVEVFEIEPENAQALIAQASLRLAEGDIDSAIPNLRVVLKNEPESVQALLLLARAHEKNRSIDLALDNYKRLISIQPDNVSGLLGAARISIEKNQKERVEALLYTVLKIEKSNREAILLLTNIYLQEKRWTDALEITQRLIQNDNSKAMGYYLQGRTYLQKRDYTISINLLKKSLENDPRIVEALRALVSAYLLENKIALAIEYVKEHVSDFPEHAHAKELLASLHARAGDVDVAIATVNDLIQESPERISAYRLLSRIYSSNNQTEKIETLYKQGLKLVPESSALKLMLAEYYQLVGKYPLAVETYEQVLAINPNALLIKNNLASLLIDHFNNDETVKRVEKLVEDLARTDNPAFLDTAGWAQYHLGNYPQSIALLIAATEKGGDGEVFHYHLGMAYLKSDMKAQAKEHLELAVQNNENDYVGKKEAMSELSKL